MTIRRRIFLFQLAVGACLLLLAGFAYTAISTMSANLDRVQWSHRQMAASLQLAAAVNDYAEQVAEVLLIGESERPDLDEARATVGRVLNESIGLTRSATDNAASPAARNEEAGESERLALIATHFQDTDRAVEQVLLLALDGRRDEALALFRSQIENRFDADFGRLIDETLADEREEVARVAESSDRLARFLLSGTVVLVLATLLAATALGTQFRNAIATPLQRLTEGAAAIESGDLSHRVALARADEFGALATRFDAMAAELEAQRENATGARARLEREIQARTAELADVNRRLRELDRQRVRFLMDTSHELRTPLTILRGEAELALRTERVLERPVREALELVVAQADHMGHLIEDLLYLARTEADDVRFEIADVDLGSVLDMAVTDAIVIARNKGTQIEVQSASPPRIVRADPRRLKQVVLILLDNAIKYGPSRSVVMVGIREAGGRVELLVENDLAAPYVDRAAHAFGRFYRGPNSGGVAGVGLGLTIARRIVEKLSGQLELAGVDGGRRMRVTLRFADRGSA
jgi:two-component system OmpR family sensor kinase